PLREASRGGGRRRGSQPPGPHRSPPRRTHRRGRCAPAAAGRTAEGELMVRKLVAFALYQPLFLVLVTVLFIGAGIVAFRALPVEAFPDVTDVQATVITLVPGHAAEEVEKQVTIPLEIVLAGVPHAVRMFSHTQFGLSFLTLTFDDEVDDYFARQRVLERLQQADLPPDIQPQLAPLSTPVGELYRFRLVSDHASPTE